MVASSGWMSPFWSMASSGSVIMRTIWLTVVVVWAAGSRVSASIPIAVVRVPPCLGPPVVCDVLPPPQAASSSAATPSAVMIRGCMTLTPPSSRLSGLDRSLTSQGAAVHVQIRVDVISEPRSSDDWTAGRNESPPSAD